MNALHGKVLSLIRFFPILLLSGVFSLCPQTDTCATPKVHAPTPPLQDSPARHPLNVSNKSAFELLSIHFAQGETKSIARLDLGPEASEEIENPGGTATLRMDLGLSLCSWDRVNLNTLVSFTLCPEHADCLIVQTADEKSVHLAGQCKSLLPKPGQTPVCSLDKFKPGMTMKDACGLVNANWTTDDNAVITSLGFGGLVWSARLYAGGTTNGEFSSEQLEDVELRQTLTAENLKLVKDALASQKYVPWQAEFPGVEMDFSEMKSFTNADRLALLDRCIESLLATSRGEATIMFAPADLFSELATADAPQKDVQLFTLLLSPDTKTLLLDMAAFRGEELREAHKD